MVVFQLYRCLPILLLLNFLLPSQVRVPLLQIVDVKFLLAPDLVELELVGLLAFQQL